jgi:uncharacterized protein involved in exopolysaccharide biosynthesis
MSKRHSGDDAIAGREVISRSGPTDEIRVLGVFAVLIRRRRTVFLTAASIVIAAVVVSVVKPSTYTAQAILVPASAVRGAGGTLSSDGGSQGLAQLLGAESPQPDQLLDVVLKSHTLADSMVAHFGGDTLPEAEQDHIRSMLKDRTEIVKVEGGLQVSVSGDDPAFVTRMANLIPPLANRVISGLSTQVAARREAFLEGQLAHAGERLAISEQRMVQFQTTQSAPELEEQAKHTMEVAAQLQQEILAQEIKIAQLRRTATPNNPELQAETSKLSGMRGQLTAVTSGDRSNSKVLLSFKDSPELQAEAARLLRDYQMGEQVYTALSNALAQAQVDAHNNLPVLTVLDDAIPPEYPDGLGLPLVLALALVTGVVAGAGLALLREYTSRAKQDAGNEDFFLAWEKMKLDLSRGIPRRHAGSRSGGE